MNKEIIYIAVLSFAAGILMTVLANRALEREKTVIINKNNVEIQVGHETKTIIKL
jgi:hypothetical protein